MDIKEYLKIIKANIKLFLATIIIIVIGVLLYFNFQPVRYDASILVNITRLGSQETSQYDYDDFYRLQADQMFGDTLVEWVKSPRFSADITPGAQKLSAERRSSQFVEIRFSSSDAKQAEKISASIVGVLNGYTEDLNENQKQTDWFLLKAKMPVIGRYLPDYGKIILAAFLIGIFLGFWVVMGKNYFSANYEQYKTMNKI